jgi:glycosyltransferase involved in cell wall biosynthesis
MRIAFIARSTLHSAPGGDTVQVLQTARHLERLGVSVEIRLTNEEIDYRKYSILHFFNLTRPADILHHIARTSVPFVVSPIFIDYNEYDRNHRNGIGGRILRSFSPSQNEYLKTIGRWLKTTDVLRSKEYLWLGQRRCIEKILNRASFILPNSHAEWESIRSDFKFSTDHFVVNNGVDDQLFQPGSDLERIKSLVLCAARIEGIKNQLNLIKALNNTNYTLILVGSPSPNQLPYYNECRKIAGSNIRFENHVPQEVLINYYKTAQVHALPSWFETCGLSSLEAAAMGCNIAITDKGYTREYFGNDAFYCDPNDPESIYKGIDAAARSEPQTNLQQRILAQYTWKETAAATLSAYNKIQYQ